jgi:hypothetical protein
MKVTVSITPQSLCVAASVGVFAALIVRAVVSRRSAPRAPQSSVERIFTPLPAVLAACAAAEGGSQETQRRREWMREAPTALPKVPLLLWVAYRQWVDSVISGQKGKSESFHPFVYGWTLGLHVSPNNLKDHWSGAEAADLLATLAAADMLEADGAAPLDALKAWLERALAVFDGRFLLARDRQYVGLTHAEEANWTGSYDFIQLADPQVADIQRPAATLLLTAPFRSWLGTGRAFRRGRPRALPRPRAPREARRVCAVCPVCCAAVPGLTAALVAWCAAGYAALGCAVDRGADDAACRHPARQPPTPQVPAHLGRPDQRLPLE